ncbi:hypothetical protein QCA50_012492 [Cerrena zonata]|uniref:C2 domain-containing protein n=1 Tax=Cerrena zonata TaxID=2478898 RepID=A0AAW0G094_9APHY
MAPSFVLRIHRVSDVQLRKRFFEKKTPLYVEIKIEDGKSKRTLKTKQISGTSTQWDEEFTLDAIEEDQTIRLCLKLSSFIHDRLIGEVECRPSDFLSSAGMTIQRDLRLFSSKNKEKIPAGIVVASGEYLQSGDEQQHVSENDVQNPHEEDTYQSSNEEVQETQELVSELPTDPIELPTATHEIPEEREEPPEEAQVPPKDEAQHTLAEARVAIDKQLGPGSMSEKVGKLLERLKLLSGVVSKIDALAKLHPWVDFAWQVCTSLYKVVEKQQSTDKRIFDLVAAIEDAFDFVEDVEKINEDAIRLEPIITAMLNQVTECATFMCTFLQPNFAGRVVVNLVTDLTHKINEFIAAFAKLRKNLTEKVQLHTALVSSKVLGGVEQLRILFSLALSI